MNFAPETLKAARAYTRAIREGQIHPGAPAMQRRVRAYHRARVAGVHPQELRVLREAARDAVQVRHVGAGSSGAPAEVRP